MTYQQKRDLFIYLLYLKYKNIRIGGKGIIDFMIMKRHLQGDGDNLINEVRTSDYINNYLSRNLTKRPFCCT